MGVVWEGPVASLPLPILTIEDDLATSTLTFIVTDDSFEGDYSCSALYTNCTLPVVSSSAVFTILPSPEIILGPILMLATAADNVTLNCSSTNTGSVNITWTGPNGDLSAELVVAGNVVSSFLVLTEVDSGAGGEYTCTATNEAGEDSATEVLYVRPVVSPGSRTADNGGMVDFTCVVQDTPAGNITWERMDESGNFTSLVVTETTLTISVVFSSTGRYRCVVSTALFDEDLQSPTALLTGELLQSAHWMKIWIYSACMVINHKSNPGFATFTCIYTMLVMNLHASRL